MWNNPCGVAVEALTLFIHPFHTCAITPHREANWTSVSLLNSRPMSSSFPTIIFLLHLFFYSTFLVASSLCLRSGYICPLCDGSNTIKNVLKVEHALLRQLPLISWMKRTEGFLPPPFPIKYVFFSFGFFNYLACLGKKSSGSSNGAGIGRFKYFKSLTHTHLGTHQNWKSKYTLGCSKRWKL